MTQRLDFGSGVFSGEPPHTVRTVGELCSIFGDQNAAASMDPGTVVYEIHGGPAEVEGAGRLLYATTVLHPGRVGSEFFMTRGHFHIDPERGELMFTLRGTGALILMDRARDTWTEAMSPGSVHDIDGRHAHRVANTGEEPLIFLVAWMSDCGHDYASIAERGFCKRLVAGERGPELCE